MPSRREFVQRSAVVGGALAGLGSVQACASSGAAGAPQRSALESAVIPARGAASAIKQSVCRWCFNDMSLDELAANAKRIGLHSVELIGPTDFETIKKHGLMCAMVSQAGPGGIPKGCRRFGRGWRRAGRGAMRTRGVRAGGSACGTRQAGPLRPAGGAQPEAAR